MKLAQLLLENKKDINSLQWSSSEITSIKDALVDLEDMTYWLAVNPQLLVRPWFLLLTEDKLFQELLSHPLLEQIIANHNDKSNREINVLIRNEYIGVISNKTGENIILHDDICNNLNYINYDLEKLQILKDKGLKLNYGIFSELVNNPLYLLEAIHRNLMPFNEEKIASYIARDGSKNPLLFELAFQAEILSNNNNNQTDMAQVILELKAMGCKTQSETYNASRLCLRTSKNLLLKPLMNPTLEEIIEYYCSEFKHVYSMFKLNDKLTKNLTTQAKKNLKSSYKV